MKTRIKMLTLTTALMAFALSFGVSFVGDSVETKASENVATVTTLEAFDMIAGASVRKTAPLGIRFTATMTAEKYATIIQDGRFVDGVEEVGMAIVPTQYFTAFNAQSEVTDYIAYFTQKLQEVDATKTREDIVLPVVESQIKLSSATTGIYAGRYEYSGALVDINSNNLTLDYQAVGYIKMNGVYEYTVSDSRNITYVAEKAIADNEGTNPMRLTVEEAKMIGETFGISYHQLNLATGLNATTSVGDKLLVSDPRLLANDALTIEFDYGYTTQAVVTAGETTIATAVGAGKLLYPVTEDVEFNVGTKDVAYRYSGTAVSSNSSGSGDLALDEDGFMTFPDDVKWGVSYPITIDMGGVAQRLVSFEMKVSDLAEIIAGNKSLFQVGFVFGANAMKVGISKVTQDGDYYVLTLFSNNGTLTATETASVSVTAETFKMTFVSSPTRPITTVIYLDGVKVGQAVDTTTNPADARVGIWFDTRALTDTPVCRYTYCLSDYAVFDGTIKTYTVTAADGMTITKEDGMVTNTFEKGENAIISFNYGYDKDAVVRANGTQIARVLGAGKLCYPVTEDVTFTVGTSAVTYKYSGTIDSTGTAVSNREMTLDTDGFVELPQDVKWGKKQIVSYQNGEVSQRIVTLEMKVEDLKKGFTHLGVGFGNDDGGSNKAAVIAIKKFVDNGDNTYTFSFNTSYCASTLSNYTIAKPDDGIIKLSFVSRGSSGRATRTISVYLNGELVGNVTTSSVDSRMYMWFDTRSNTEATAYRVNYSLSNGYGVLE